LGGVRMTARKQGGVNLLKPFLLFPEGRNRSGSRFIYTVLMVAFSPFLATENKLLIFLKSTFYYKKLSL
jgi:hypothetical protein